MDTPSDNRTGFFPRRSQMSTLAIHPSGTPGSTTRSAPRAAGRPGARSAGRSAVRSRPAVATPARATGATRRPGTLPVPGPRSVPRSRVRHAAVPVGVATPVRRSVRHRPQAVSVRLTRRGRLVVVALMALLVLGVFAFAGPQSAATGTPGQPVPTRTVEVGPGQTLWGLAAQVAQPGKVREMVHQIEELNALTGPGVSVGQRIAVPVG